jgi:type I restriction enzyme S subunit
VKLGELVIFRTGKLDSNAACDNGEYPFFTCSQETYRTNTYTFDCEAVLLGGNNANGIYPLKYFRGKFDAYQRTYVICSKDNNVLLNRYLYYALRPKLSLLQSHSSGVTTKFLTLGILKNIDLDVPPKENQSKIASILSAYDDLIENNTRRIKILEEMAQRIYKEWFVDFRFPGHKKVKFVNSELGKIPEGWRVELLDKYVDFERGVEPGSNNYEKNATKENIPFLRVGDLGNRSIEIFVNQSLTENKIIKEDDIAVSMDGTPGIVKMGLFGCYSTGIRKLVIKDNIMKKSFLYFLMISEHIQNIIKAHSKGTTILHASESIKNMNFILPASDLMKIFDEMVSPMIKEILSLNKKNKILRETRDLLLPKLISGELDVSDLDINTGEINERK